MFSLDQDKIHIRHFKDVFWKSTTFGLYMFCNLKKTWKKLFIVSFVQSRMDDKSKKQRSIFYVWGFSIVDAEFRRKIRKSPFFSLQVQIYLGNIIS